MTTERFVACELDACKWSGRERRVAVRYPYPPDTACQLIGLNDPEEWPATIRDLSATGIGLLVGRYFPPGSLVGIELDNAAQGVMKRLPARVIHALECPNGDWLHGCAFLDPLTNDDIKALVS